MSRKQAREDVFRLIFALGLSGDDGERDVLEEYFDTLGDKDRWVIKAADEADAAYIRTVFTGVTEKLSEIDGIIEKSAENWSLSRMSRVSLCALRLCVYELLYMPQVPASAAINEAVALSGIYGGEKEKKFVNGVLGKIAKTSEDK